MTTTSAVTIPAPPIGKEDLVGGGPPSPPSGSLRPNIVFNRRLTLRQISSRSGGPVRLRLPHWGSLSDMAGRWLVVAIRVRVGDVVGRRRFSCGRRPVPGAGEPLDQRGAQFRHACAGKRAQTNGADFTIFVALDARLASPGIALVANQDLRHLVGADFSQHGVDRCDLLVASRMGVVD